MTALLLAAASTIIPAVAAERSGAIPNVSGQWGRNVLNFEAPESGPGPIFNLNIRPDGTYNNDVPVGDYTSPILRPEAAAVLRERGEASLLGQAFPSPHNQCWPEPTPFTLIIQWGVHILQTSDEVILTYLSNHQVRRVRLNERHPEDIALTWQGHSVGHYEGDMLVIDTVGIKVGPFSMVDRYGTPHSEALHVVERYRLIDGVAAREAAAVNENLYRNLGGRIRGNYYPYNRGRIDPDVSRDGLQIEILVEDQRMFTMPWSGRVTYRPVVGDWPEAVCAERTEPFAGMELRIPASDRQDF